MASLWLASFWLPPLWGCSRQPANMNVLLPERESGMIAHPYAQEAQGGESPGFTYFVDKNYSSNP